MLFFALASVATVAAKSLVCSKACASRISTLEANVHEVQIRLAQFESGADRRCRKEVNAYYKACDINGDGCVNGSQGVCTLAECEAFCEMHAGFRCNYFSYHSAKSECYMFENCENVTAETGWVTHALRGRRFPLPGPVAETKELGETREMSLKAMVTEGNRTCTRTPACACLPAHTPACPPTHSPACTCGRISQGKQTLADSRFVCLLYETQLHKFSISSVFAVEPIHFALLLVCLAPILFW